MYREPRRHRLNEDETPIVIGLLYQELLQISTKQVDAILAEEIWHILLRFEENKPGRPFYPEFSWNQLQTWLSK